MATQLTAALDDPVLLQLSAGVLPSRKQASAWEDLVLEVHPRGRIRANLPTSTTV
jgi:hypothetical protein